MQRTVPEPMVIPASVWRERKRQHSEILRPYARERLDRVARGIKHPIHDFLFEYYNHKPLHLLRWSPGVGTLLKDASPEDVEWPSPFLSSPDGMILNHAAIPEHRIGFIQWVIHYLESIGERPPALNCLGLHEWAMVYREPQIRHATTPLRLNPEELNQFVESQDLRCTHYDAFRFFSLPARPRNRLELTRSTTDQFDQSGCVHVNMDLYKWAYKMAPFTSGELIRDTFLLAWEARQLDMRASPYDLRSYGLQPITIETHEGREEYVAAQRALSRAAAPLRLRLLEEYLRCLRGLPEIASSKNSGDPSISLPTLVLSEGHSGP